MKKIIPFLSILCLLIPNFSLAQSGWIQVNPGFGHSYNGVHFINENTGLACGNNGAIIKSTNGGIAWTNLNSSTTTDLKDVKLLTPYVGVACGYSVIIRTTDGGQNWVQVYQGGSNIKKLRTFGNNQVMAYASSAIIKSSNAGSAWTYQNINPTYLFQCVDFIDFSTGWVFSGYASGYHDVQRTTDGGASWTLVNHEVLPQAQVYLSYFFGNSLGFRVTTGPAGFCVYKSTTQGSSWTGSYFITSQQNGVNSIFFVNSTKGWFVCNNSLVCVSTNGANSWIQQTANVNANLVNVFFSNENTGWIAASSEGILRTTDGGGTPTGIGTKNETGLTSPSLSQNYPNPFNPVTRMKYDVPSTPLSFGEGLRVRLIIYDILGREIETLVNQTQKPGSYEVTWDGSRFASGVYFYKLITDEYSETKKMVLIK